MDSPITNRDSDKFVLRLPEGMRQEIASIAQKNGRSMNAEIVARLQDSLSEASASSRNSRMTEEILSATLMLLAEPLAYRTGDAIAKLPPRLRIAAALSGVLLAASRPGIEAVLAKATGLDRELLQPAVDVLTTSALSRRIAGGAERADWEMRAGWSVDQLEKMLADIGLGSLKSEFEAGSPVHREDGAPVNLKDGAASEDAGGSLQRKKGGNSEDKRRSLERSAGAVVFHSPDGRLVPAAPPAMRKGSVKKRGS